MEIFYVIDVYDRIEIGFYIIEGFYEVRVRENQFLKDFGIEL